MFLSLTFLTPQLSSGSLLHKPTLPCFWHSLMYIFFLLRCSIIVKYLPWLLPNCCRYIRGRLQYTQVNAAVVEINKALETKYNLLSRPRAKLSELNMKIVGECQRQENKETKGLRVVFVMKLLLSKEGTKIPHPFRVWTHCKWFGGRVGKEMPSRLDTYWMSGHTGGTFSRLPLSLPATHVQYGPWRY